MGDRPPIRIVVGEAQPLVREGIVHVLEEAGFDVVAVAGDADEVVRKACAHHPDVVMTDIQLPPGRIDDGPSAALRIRATHPDIGLVVLSQFLEEPYARALIGEHAHGVGYLLKDQVGDLALFIDSIRRVARGGSALDPEVVERMVGRGGGAIGGLTPRERQVLSLMAEGRSNHGIANVLIVTVAAVERHVGSIFAKLGLRQGVEDHRRVLAVLRYLQR